MPCKRASYDASFKLKVIQKADDLGSNQKSAEYSVLTKKQVREWRKSCDQFSKVKKTTKRLEGAGRLVTSKNLDDKLLTWLHNARAEGHAISGTALQLQARRMTNNAAFKASNGWLTN